MNVSDSERIAGFLELHNLTPAKDINKTDFVIFNTCGVRQTAEDRVYGQIHNLRKNNPKIKIILTGCLANRKDVQRRLKNKVDLFCEIKYFPEKINSLLSRHPELDPRFKSRHPELDSKSSEGSTKKYCDQYYKADSSLRWSGTQNDGLYFNILPKYNNKHAAFVPIMTGCNNFCSYCVVPYARGPEVSRPIDDIIKEVKELSKKGCKEITLLGQNVNSYTYKVKSQNSKVKIAIQNSKIDFPCLLNYLAQNFSDITLKFITSHPKDFSEKLIDVIAKNKNISREIHLPVQAGSDKILKAMNRPYTQKKYLALIGKIKKKIPNATFTTDVIVGFPGETKKDFEESVKVFKQVSYNEAYINKYSPRPKTSAWKLGDPVSWEEKKRREKKLRSLIDYGKDK